MAPMSTLQEHVGEVKRAFKYVSGVPNGASMSTPGNIVRKTSVACCLFRVMWSLQMLAMLWRWPVSLDKFPVKDGMFTEIGLA